jgi:hypothetical protein
VNLLGVKAFVGSLVEVVVKTVAVEQGENSWEEGTRHSKEVPSGVLGNSKGCRALNRRVSQESLE